MKIKPIILMTVCSLTISANAAVILSAANVKRLDDTGGAGVGSLDPDGNGNRVVANNYFVGFFNLAGVEDVSTVWVFQMTGTATGANITGADFEVTQSGANGGGSLMADAHIIRTASTDTIITSDYQTSALLLQSDFAASGIGAQSLDSGGQTSLTSYLQSNWVENDYVFIGLKNSSAPTGLTFENSDARNTRTYDGTGTLTLTAVPEPSSSALLLLGGLAFSARRKR